MAMYVTIDRSDYSDNKDSEGTHYFDYILQQLDIPKEEHSQIVSVQFDVKNGGFEVEKKCEEDE